MRRTAKEFLNNFRQRLIENQPPIDFKNPQKGFPGWWEDDHVLDDAKKNKKKEQKPKYEDYGEEQDMVDELPPTK